MGKRRFGRLLQVAGALIIATLAVGWVALADSVVADGDGLIPVTAGTLNLGSVCLDTAISADPSPLVAIERNQDGPDVFADNSSVSVSVSSVTGRGLTASIGPPGVISIPGDWTSSEVGTMSPELAVDVDFTPIFVGPFIGSVSLTASGVNADGAEIIRTTSLAVTATGVDCGRGIAPTSMSVPPASGPYGGLTTLTAVLTAGEAGISGKTVSFTLNGIHVGDAVTDVSGVATVPGVSLAGIDIGTYPGAIGASFAGDSMHRASSGTGRLIVENAVATLSLIGLDHVYDGTPKSATVTTDPPGLSGVQVTYDGEATEPVNAGTYTVVASLANDEFKAEAVEGTLVISKAETSVTVDCPVGSYVYGGSAHTPCTAVVTGPGGLNQPVEIVYSDNINAGTAAASASYPGSDNYEASSGSATFEILKAAQTIRFTRRSSIVFGDSSFQVSAEASSGLPVTVVSQAPEVCTVIGSNTVNLLRTGICTIEATQPGDANYNAALPVKRSFLVIFWIVIGL